MRISKLIKKIACSISLLTSLTITAAERFVSFQQGDLLINASSKVSIYLDNKDCNGVDYAAKALAKDITKVCGSKTTLTSNINFISTTTSSAQRANIIIGTLGHSAAIDKMAKQKRINVNQREMGKIHHNHRRRTVSHSRKRSSRHHLWHIRTIATDRSFSLV